ncbi:MAG: class I tRNA ligase family protein, partial [Desulfurobacteriaceae bacterium]
KHVIYVWFDALTNYLTAVGYPDDTERFNRYWPADLHLVGKDILRFHAVYWPAFLMSAGLPLPKRVFAHGWWTVEGEKMSKSKGNVVDPFDIVEKFGVDQVRFFLFREVSFGLDGDFSYEKLVARINGELANDLGNLFNRTLSMLKKYRKSVVPEPKGDFDDLDVKIKNKASATLKAVAQMIPKAELSKALDEIWQFVGFVNYYIDRRAPWTLNKEGKDQELDTVLYNMVESLRFITAFLYPYMPSSAQRMADLLRLGRKVEDLRVSEFEEWGGMEPGKEVEKGGILFPRIEYDKDTGEVRIAKTKKG